MVAALVSCLLGYLTIYQQRDPVIVAVARSTSTTVVLSRAMPCRPEPNVSRSGVVSDVVSGYTKRSLVVGVLPDLVRACVRAGCPGVSGMCW